MNWSQLPYYILMVCLCLGAKSVGAVESSKEIEMIKEYEKKAASFVNITKENSPKDFMIVLNKIILNPIKEFANKKVCEDYIKSLRCSIENLNILKDNEGIIYFSGISKQPFLNIYENGLQEFDENIERIENENKNLLENIRNFKSHMNSSKKIIENLHNLKPSFNFLKNFYEIFQKGMQVECFDYKETKEFNSSVLNNHKNIIFFNIIGRGKDQEFRKIKYFGDHMSSIHAGLESLLNDLNRPKTDPYNTLEYNFEQIKEKLFEPINYGVNIINKLNIHKNLFADAKNLMDASVIQGLKVKDFKEFYNNELKNAEENLTKFSQHKILPMQFMSSVSNQQFNSDSVIESEKPARKKNKKHKKH